MSHSNLFFPRLRAYSHVSTLISGPFSYLLFSLSSFFIRRPYKTLFFFLFSVASAT